MKIKIAAVFVTLLFIVSCGRGSKAPLPLQEINVGTVTKDTIERKVLFTGNILAEAAFDVFPRATGKISKKVLKEGDAVKRGQPIFLVERDEIGYTYKSMPIVSLVDGVVGKINVDVGANVDLQTPVATIVHPGKMRVKLDIPERYLNIIATGTKVSMKVDSLGGEIFDGQIVSSSPFVDEKTRTSQIEVSLPNTDGRLKHGMFGRMNLVVEKKDGALIVPSNAISWEGEKQFVYKLKETNKVERLQVKLGLRNDTHVEALEGVKEGDRVATSGLVDLEDNETIAVKNDK